MRKVGRVAVLIAAVLGAGASARRKVVPVEPEVAAPAEEDESEPAPVRGGGTFLPASVDRLSKIDVSYDRFHQSKRATLTALVVVEASDHVIAVSLSSASEWEGKPVPVDQRAVTITVFRMAEEMSLGTCTVVKLLVDGRPVAPVETHDISNPGSHEKLAVEGQLLKLDMATFLDLAGAESVEGRLCSESFLIPSEAMARVRLFAREAVK